MTRTSLSSVWAIGMLTLALGACAGETEMSSTNAQTKTKTQQADASIGTPEGAGEGENDVDGSNNGGDQPLPAGDQLLAIEREFQVSKEEHLELTYNPELGLLSQDLALRRSYEPATRTFVQNTRTAVVATHTQGSTGTNREQTYAQDEKGILDLQIIIDDSGSMAGEQDLLAANLPPLLSRIAGTNWRMNIATTSYSRGCSRALINKGDADAATAFDAGIRAGTNGSGNEEGIRMAVEGLRCNTAADWVRDQSTVAVLIVSDEDNCSVNGGDCSSRSWNAPAYLTTGFLSKSKANGGLGRQLGYDARVYAIIRPDEASCKSKDNNVGTQYVTAANETGGIVGKICAPSYESILTRISEDIATLLKSQFELSTAPDAGTLVVRINGVETTSGFTLSGKVVTFQSAPAFGSTIKFNYVSGAAPIKTRFSLAPSVPSGRSIVTSTLVVKVNGQTVAPPAYTFDPATKEVVFAAAPAPLASIVTSFKIDDQPLLTGFPLGTSAVRAGSVKVSVNDQATGAFTYAAGVVTLATAPAEGASVKVTYDLDQGPLLAYPLSLVGTTIRDVKAFDQASGDEVEATFSNGTLTIASDGFAEGRVLTVQYKNELSGEISTELPQAPVAGSFSIETGRDDCAVGSGITLVGKTLTMHCDWEMGDQVVVRYRYVLPPLTSFTVAGVTQPDVGEWQVRINGVATTAFSRSGSTIELTTPPPAGSIVKIVYKTKAS